MAFVKVHGRAFLQQMASEAFDTALGELLITESAGIALVDGSGGPQWREYLLTAISARVGIAVAGIVNLRAADKVGEYELIRLPPHPLPFCAAKRGGARVVGAVGQYGWAVRGLSKRRKRRF